MKDPIDVREQLKGYVRESGLSIRQLTEVAGVSHTSLVRFLNDGLDVRLSTVVKLCQVLGLKLTRYRPEVRAAAVKQRRRKKGTPEIARDDEGRTK